MDLTAKISLRAKWLFCLMLLFDCGSYAQIATALGKKEHGSGLFMQLYGGISYTYRVNYTGSGNLYYYPYETLKYEWISSSGGMGGTELGYRFYFGKKQRYQTGINLTFIRWAVATYDNDNYTFLCSIANVGTAHYWNLGKGTQGLELLAGGGATLVAPPGKYEYATLTPSLDVQVNYRYKALVVGLKANYLKGTRNVEKYGQQQHQYEEVFSTCALVGFKF